MSSYSLVLDRADALCSLLEGEAYEQGRRVVDISRQLLGRHRQGERLEPTEDDGALRVELGRLVELLARRGAKAIPLATLGRAALADLAGDLAAHQAACKECETNLALAGM